MIISSLVIELVEYFLQQKKFRLVEIHESEFFHRFACNFFSVPKPIRVEFQTKWISIVVSKLRQAVFSKYQLANGDVRKTKSA